ncbi:MAG: hypothetical protein ACI9KE_003954, partial [Polyangiales bacterium]
KEALRVSLVHSRVLRLSKHLERDGSPQWLLDRAINDAHTARGKLLFNAKTPADQGAWTRTWTRAWARLWLRLIAHSLA